MAASSSSVISIPNGYLLLSTSASMCNFVFVVVLPIRLTTVARLRKGRPRQFSVMWQNIRCAILFHLLVPGGKWQTEIANFNVSANSWSDTFHNRQRLVLLPPESAGTNNFAASGATFEPIASHQRRMVSAANCAVL